MIEGKLDDVKVGEAASVLTYKVPPDYGGYADMFPKQVDKSAVNTPVDLSKAYALTKKYGNKHPHLPWLNGSKKRQKLCS